MSRSARNHIQVPPQVSAASLVLVPVALVCSSASPGPLPPEGARWVVVTPWNANSVNMDTHNVDTTFIIDMDIFSVTICSLTNNLFLIIILNIIPLPVCPGTPFLYCYEMLWTTLGDHATTIGFVSCPVRVGKVRGCHF